MRSLDNFKIYTFNHFSKQGIPHFVTTRLGGFSTGHWQSLNLSFRVNDDPIQVRKNRRRLARYVEIPLKNFVLADQIHEANIQILTEEDAGKGAFTGESALPRTDGLIATVPGLVPAILTADCAPVLFAGKHGQFVAAVHAGRRGIEQGIITRTLAMIRQYFGISADEILVGIGPRIGSCCYVVDAMTARFFTDACGPSFIAPVSRNPRLFRIDILKAIVQQVQEAYVPSDQIEYMDLCTCCNHDLFFSYRASIITGRFMTGIYLK